MKSVLITTAIVALAATGAQAAGVPPDDLPTWDIQIVPGPDEGINGVVDPNGDYNGIDDPDVVRRDDAMDSDRIVDIPVERERRPLEVDEEGNFSLDLTDPDQKVFENDFGSLDDLTISGNVDPFHTITATFTDSGPASTFLFGILTPIVPLTGLVNYTIQGTITGTDTDGNAENFLPGLSSGFFFEHRIEGTVVSSLGNTPLTEGPTPYPFSASGSFTCGAGGCSPLVSTFGLTGSGGGDVYQMTASLVVTPAPIPVPATGVLLATGLLGAAGAARLRRRK